MLLLLELWKQQLALFDKVLKEVAPCPTNELLPFTFFMNTKFVRLLKWYIYHVTVNHISGLDFVSL